jgi:membrane protease YdiL (CAAX protease family)
VHLSFYGFLSRLFLGIILGWIYQYSGRLWLSILAHFVNNAVAITALYVGTGGKPIEKVLTENETSPFGLLALPVVIALLVVFRRFSFNTKKA